MRQPLTWLTLTQNAWETMHYDLDKVRSSSRTVKVCPKALAALLADHSKLIDIVEKNANWATPLERT